MGLKHGIHLHICHLILLEKYTVRCYWCSGLVFSCTDTSYPWQWPRNLALTVRLGKTTAFIFRSTNALWGNRPRKVLALTGYDLFSRIHAFISFSWLRKSKEPINKKVKPWLASCVNPAYFFILFFQWGSSSWRGRLVFIFITFLHNLPCGWPSDISGGYRLACISSAWRWPMTSGLLLHLLVFPSLLLGRWKGERNGLWNARSWRVVIEGISWSPFPCCSSPSCNPTTSFPFYSDQGRLIRNSWLQGVTRCWTQIKDRGYSTFSTSH